MLKNNAGNNLAINASGAFVFSSTVVNGGTYAVTVATQPTSPAQTCLVSNGAGTVSGADISNVTIACTTLVGKFLYIPNTDSNNVSGYAINATNGVLTEITGSPFSAGVGAVLASAEPTNKFLYVSNQGSTTATANLSAYAINSVTGVLTQLSGSPFAFSSPAPAVGLMNIGPVTFHPSGKFGFARNGGSTGQLYGVAIDTVTGAVTQTPGAPITVSSNGLQGVTYSTSGNYLYTHYGVPSGGVALYSVDASSGVLTPIGTGVSTGGSNPAGLTIDPSGKLLFVPNVQSANLAAFTIDVPSGVLTAVAGSPFSTGAGSTPTAAVIHPTKNFMYVVNSAASSTVLAYTFNTTSGVPTAISGSPYSTNGTAAVTLKMEVTGRFLYVANLNSNTIEGYTINQSTGALTEVTGGPVATGVHPVIMAIDQSGKYLYCVNRGENTVSSYAINSSTGVLSLINTVPTGSTPINGVVVGLQ
ncbi:MAG: beta-propeller fold lactonase family protein [Steroidobacteraceae bacterium]